MPLKSGLVNGDVVTVYPLRAKATKVTLQVDLNGGAVTVTPTCRVTGTDLAATATIEYATAGDSATKATAAISASGVYEFFIENKDLVLTVSGVTGAPRMAWEASNA